MYPTMSSAMQETILSKDALANLPIPKLQEPQLSIFDRRSLLSRITTYCDPHQALKTLQGRAGTQVLAFDAGGTAIKASLLQVQDDGSLQLVDSLGQKESHDGTGYLKFIKEITDQHGLPVGISSAGVVTLDGVIDQAPNLTRFVDDLKRGGNLATILKGRHFNILNDAAALAIACACETVKQHDQIKQTIVIINGGGIGGAVVDQNGTVFATEPGHLPIMPSLNPNKVTTGCGLTSGSKPCLERVGAVGAGIEAQWEILKGNKLSGKEIGKLMSTDPKALQLFDTSALIIAHIIEGLRRAYDLPLKNTAIICYGGAFQAEGYVQRVQQILSSYYHDQLHEKERPLLLTTADLGFDNACMTGAAIGALLTFAKYQFFS